MDTLKFNIIETERLFLRELTPMAYDHVFRLYPDIRLMQFFGFKTKEELLKEKKKYQEGVTTYNRSFTWFHLVEKETHKNIGWCGFHTIYHPHRRAELGYEILDETKKGKGYMKESIKPIVNYGFETLNLNRIEAFVGPDNIASLKLIKSLGFTEEGRLRSHYYKNEVFEDSLVFSLLQREYGK